MTDSVSIENLKKLLEGGGAPVLLDVRRKAEYEASPKTIPGAVWRDPEKVHEWASEIPSGRRALVYCAKGGTVGRSVADRLAQEGFDAAFVKGGIKAWIEQGEPLE